MRVPGATASLQAERARGRDIRVVYSATDALEIARTNPDKQVVFPGVGFETTAPTIAVSILTAEKMRLKNYFVFSAHKLVPPALSALMAGNKARIDGFLLPGHVSVVIGLNAYRPLFDRYRVPSVVAGFEAVDILQAIHILVKQIEAGTPRLVNAYPRAVTPAGNLKAQQVLQEVFETTGATWRGIGHIARSGLKIRERFAAFDAQKVFQISIPEVADTKGCVCGEILTGLKTPLECPLYRSVCTPMNPVGPCMVSSEGTCAAFYRYHGSALTKPPAMD
jgi:hydrogenase expression/formation protein HypD